MSHAAMISVGILIVLIVVLALLRGKSVATKPLRGAHVALIVAVAVLVAAGIDYLVVMRPAKAAAGAAGQAPAEMGPGMGPGAGMMGPPGGGMGGGMGGPREPSPKRDLGRFVRQLTLFQEKGTDALDAKQVATVLPILTGMQAVEKMSEDEGKAQLEALRAILTEAQLAAVDAASCPAAGMGGPGGPGMAPAGAAAKPAARTAGASRPGQAFRERMLVIPTSANTTPGRRGQHLAQIRTGSGSSSAR